MSKKIIYSHINTNNLHDLTVELDANKVNCIIGPSGSGKSTLAFDTIFAISQHEMNLIMGNDELAKYEIESFSNIPSAIALKQSNFNTNKRSTIATYYGIDSILKFLFASTFFISPSMLSFNKFGSSCKECEGLGTVWRPDISKLVDLSLPVKNMPFIPWQHSGMKSYFKEILSLACEEQNIPLDVPFSRLTALQKDFLLNGTGTGKYKISFTQGGRKRTKTDTYHGIVPFLEKELQENNAMQQYCKEINCPVCDGSRFNRKIDVYKIEGKSLGDVYLTDFAALKQWLEKVRISKSALTSASYQTLVDFVNNLITLNLGYLHLNRSIPSLSGGEFQRLRLAQLLQTKFEGLLIILDEPLASVHALERENIVQMIAKMAGKNTLLIVEHNNEILKICDNVIALGPSGGKKGGFIVDKDTFLRSESQFAPITHPTGKKTFTITSNETVRNVKPFEITVPLHTIIGVGGLSGSGKTTFIRDILPNCLENYHYISQKPIKGNIYSTVASFLGVIDRIRQLFATENKVDAGCFSHFANAKGACPTCNGTGQIVVEEYNIHYTYICPDCNGVRFSNDVLKYKYQGKTIIDIYNEEINEVKEFFQDKDKTIADQLQVAVDFGLGYLQLKQAISSLSGGESQRMKLLKHLDMKKQDSFIGLDEPFQGLNNSEIHAIMQILYKMADSQNTIFIVEHNLFALQSCTFLIEFGIGSGKLGGDIIFNGKLTDIKRIGNSRLKEYL